ncbi:hypothetical protein P7D22_14260 [Lichenihabitans sp. Uapishka_5]|nr:hypothetical protein [Lichenihabitans sp. Uapishka_5]MDX7952332.1 hypothetical protein [Lichenihabitans sp. Uapishka_5]
MQGTRLAVTAAATATTVAKSRLTGFSQKMALPAAAAARSSATCVSVGLAMTTPSTAPSAKTASGSTTVAPRRAASALRSFDELLATVPGQ